MRIVFIAHVQQIAVDAAIGVDLVGGNLRAVLDRVAINRRAASQRAGAADFECRAVRRRFAGISGIGGVFSAIIFGVSGAFSAIIPGIARTAAARGQRQYHCQRQQDTQKALLFHQ